MMSSKYTIEKLGPDQYDQWNSFVDRSPQGSIFAKTWWLDAVAERWEILVCRSKTGGLLGGMPITWQKNRIKMPPLFTQTLGILLADFSGKKYAKRITQEKTVIEALVEGIPPCRSYRINFHYSLKNWLPFMWRQYRQTSRYTYVIEDLSDLDQVYSAFLDKKRNHIRKAQKADITVRTDCSLDDFYRIAGRTFSKQGMSTLFSFEQLDRLDRVLRQREARKILFVVGPDGRIHAANYIVYDQNCAYNLLSGHDPELRDSHAGSLVIWESIRFAATVSRRFDFEGSCLRPVEEFFRSFGGRQHTYYQIYRSNTLWQLLRDGWVELRLFHMRHGRGRGVV